MSSMWRKTLGQLRKYSYRTYTLVFALTLATMLSLVSFVGVTTIEVVDNGAAVTFTTKGGTVANALKDLGITLKAGDEIDVDLNSAVCQDMIINIERGVELNIVVGENTTQINTAKKTVGDVLAALGIEVGELDITEPELTAQVFEGDYIIYKKVGFDISTEQIEIAFTKKEQYNASLGDNQRKVTQQGRNGTKEIQYKNVYENGTWAYSEILSENIIQPSVDEITEVGPKPQDLTWRSINLASRGGEELRYSRVLDVTATAYCIQGSTATGMRAAPGVIAVDPKVIPLRSRVYVEAADGSWVYGMAVAGDTGGVIKGNKIDLFFNSPSDVKQFGRRQAKIYVLE